MTNDNQKTKRPRPDWADAPVSEEVARQNELEERRAAAEVGDTQPKDEWAADRRRARGQHAELHLAQQSSDPCVRWRALAKGIRQFEQAVDGRLMLVVDKSTPGAIPSPSLAWVNALRDTTTALLPSILKHNIGGTALRKSERAAGHLHDLLHRLDDATAGCGRPVEIAVVLDRVSEVVSAIEVAELSLLDDAFVREALALAAQSPGCWHEIEGFIGCGGAKWDPRSPADRKKGGQEPRGKGYERARKLLKQMHQHGLLDRRSSGGVAYKITQLGRTLNRSRP